MLNKICSVCGDFTVIENLDLCICASCNKDIRKAEKEALKPQKTFKHIAPMSENYKKRNKLKMKTYHEIEKKEITWCESCGCTDRPLSRSHILPVGKYPQFEAVEENIIIECFGDSDSCHFIYENSPIEEKMKLLTWDRKVEVILKLAPSYLDILMIKYNNDTTI